MIIEHLAKIHFCYFTMKYSLQEIPLNRSIAKKLMGKNKYAFMIIFDVKLNFRLIFLIIFGIIYGSVFSQTFERPLFSFGVVADVQYADIPDWGTRHYRKSPEKLADAVDQFNRSEVAFVISLGDFINDKMSGFDTLNAITQKLKMPLFHVAGNHDFDPENPNRKQTMRYMNLKKLNYSFSCEGWRFIVLNGNDISLYTKRPGSKGYVKTLEMLRTLEIKRLPQAQPWNGALGQKQLKWLNAELKRANSQNERVIISCHFPIHSEKTEGRLWNSSAVNDIINKFPNVYAYLAGHGHISQHILNDGIHHLMFRGMVEGDNNAYSIISVYSDRITIEGFGMEVNRVLKN